jgi:FMN phosphatase YigB (HAD superfamily)
MLYYSKLDTMQHPGFLLKGENKKRLIVFDLDDTLVKTDAKIKVISRTTQKVLKELTPEEFNFYVNSPSKFLSFEDFEDPEILRQGKFIQVVLEKLLAYYRRKMPVAIVTARSSSSLVRNFFLEHGIDIHPELVIAVNDPLSGIEGETVALRKLEALKRLKSIGFTDFTFFDDNEDNLRLSSQMRNLGVKIKLILVEDSIPLNYDKVGS